MIAPDELVAAGLVFPDHEVLLGADVVDHARTALEVAQRGDGDLTAHQRAVAGHALGNDVMVGG